MRDFRSAAAALVALVGMMLPAARAETWSVLSADFSERQGELLRLDASGAHLKTGDGALTIPLDEFLQADRTDPPRVQQPRLELHLAGGDVIAGQPEAIREESLAWRHPMLGEMVFPLRQVVSITRIGRETPAGPAPLEDTILLANGDVVTSIVSSIDGKQLTIATPDPVEIALENIAAIRLASPAAPPAPAGTLFRVGVAPDSVLTASAVSVDDRRAMLSLPSGQKFSVERVALVSVEQLNGPVSWLSSRPPAQDVHTPYLDLSFPNQMDRTVDGGPIRFGGRTYARGIGVHAYSRLVWPLDGTYQTLRLQYAIDGDRPQADAHVRILLDGKIVHENPSVRSGTLSPVVQVPLGDAKSLTLEVDYGRGYGVQDRVIWIEPALLKSAPTSQPATDAGEPEAE